MNMTHYHTMHHAVKLRIGKDKPSADGIGSVRYVIIEDEDGRAYDMTIFSNKPLVIEREGE